MNPNTIPWIHYQDIQVSDKEIRKQFNNYIDKGQYIEAINLLATNEAQLKGKAFVSDTINKIMSGIFDLETMFDNNVHVYLSSLASQYTIIINNFVKRGEWNNRITYSPYNFIVYQQEVYMNIQECNGILPTNGAYWLKIGLRGVPGTPGIDVIMKYDWSSGTLYKHRDIVVYEGNLYYAIEDNVNIRPDTSATKWQLFLMVDKGEIYVGTTEPQKKLNNTVWFKTETNPLNTTDTTFGTFYRYVYYDNSWEVMYPSTITAITDNLNLYAPKSETINIDIKSNQWLKSNGEFFYRYYNRGINEKSFVKIFPQSNIKFYSSLKLNIDFQSSIITLKTKMSPSNLSIVIQIQ